MTGSVIESTSRTSGGRSAGDQNAEVLFHRYGAEVARYAERLGSADPDGVANQAIFDAVRRLPQDVVCQEKIARSYIYRAAHGHTVDELRRRKPVIPVDPAKIETPIVEGETNLDVSILLDEALSELTQKQITVIRRRFLEQRSIEEIAQELGATPNTIYQIQHRALARLRLFMTAAMVLIALAGAAAWRATISEQSLPVESSDQRSTSTDRSSGGWKVGSETAPPVDDSQLEFTTTIGPAESGSLLPDEAADRGETSLPPPATGDASQAPVTVQSTPASVPAIATSEQTSTTTSVPTTATSEQTAATTSVPTTPTSNQTTTIVTAPPTTTFQSSGQNLLINGSFESVILPDATLWDVVQEGWTSSRAGNVIETWEGGYEQVDAPDGRNLIELNGDGADSISQTVAVVPGAVYEVSYRHRGRATRESMQVSVNGRVIATSSSPTFSWGSITAPFTAGPDETSVTLQLTSLINGSVGNLVDDVRLIRIR